MVLRRYKVDWGSFAFHCATGLATAALVGMLVIILGNIIWHGAGQISLHFIFGDTNEGMFDAQKAGVFPSNTYQDKVLNVWRDDSGGSSSFTVPTTVSISRQSPAIRAKSSSVWSRPKSPRRQFRSETA